MQDKIQIRMEAYDYEALDQAALDIVETSKRTGARVSGPVPLPTNIERYTVLRSPHTDFEDRGCTQQAQHACWRRHSHQGLGTKARSSRVSHGEEIIVHL